MFRSLKMLSTPASPVSLTEAKTACRIDTSAMDTAVQDLLSAAIEQAEHDTDQRCAIGNICSEAPSWIMNMQDLGRPPMQTLPAWPLYIAAWPLAPYLELPKPPLVSVDQIRYYDANNVLRALDPTIYSVDASPRRGRITLLPDQVWPICADVELGADHLHGRLWAASQVPSGIKVGIQKLVSYWYYNPGAGDVPAEIARIFERYAAKCQGYQ